MKEKPLGLAEVVRGLPNNIEISKGILRQAFQAYPGIIRGIALASQNKSSFPIPPEVRQYFLSVGIFEATQPGNPKSKPHMNPVWVRLFKFAYFDANGEMQFNDERDLSTMPERAHLATEISDGLFSKRTTEVAVPNLAGKIIETTHDQLSQTAAMPVPGGLIRASRPDGTIELQAINAQLHAEAMPTTMEVSALPHPVATARAEDLAAWSDEWDQASSERTPKPPSK